MAHQLDLASETLRLQELGSYSILDTLPEQDYDDLTTLAAEICGTPISLITMIDHNRQWFKSGYGTDVSETTREHSFCAHAIIQPQLFVVEDARNDARFKDNPLVTGEPYIVFYAGVPLVTQNGQSLGTICVMDRKPRKLSDRQVDSLSSLSNQVMKLLELRKKEFELVKANSLLSEQNDTLEHFAQLVAHDLKSPLRNCEIILEDLISKSQDELNSESIQRLFYLKEFSKSLKKLVNGLLENAKADMSQQLISEDVSVNEITRELQVLFPDTESENLTFSFKLDAVHANKTDLLSVFINLISNAIRYNDKTVAEVDIGGRELDGRYEFYVSDNGPGFSQEDYYRIFEMFTVLQPTDRNGEFSTGIGLANVKKIMERSNGEVDVHSTQGEGSIFTFSIPRESSIHHDQV